MGLCSSVADPPAPRPANNVRVTVETTAPGAGMEAPLPAMSRSELDKKRREFWETRVEGNPECWQALRTGVESRDQELSRALFTSASLTELSMDRQDSYHSYDAKGVRYDIPVWVIYDPPNLIKEGDAKQPSTAHPPSTTTRTTSSTAATAATAAGARQLRPAIKCRVRMNNSGADIPLEFSPDETALDAKRRLAERQKLPADKLRLLCDGRVVPDSIPLEHVMKSFPSAKKPAAALGGASATALEGDSPILQIWLVNASA